MKKIITTIFIVIIFIMASPLAKAATLIKEPIDDVWVFRKGGGLSAFSTKYTNYTIDGKTTYCIEAGVKITTDNYNDNVGINNLPYDDEKNHMLYLIGYYGYDYPNHNTVRYRMATQALIWELTSGQTVEFWTKPSGAGTFISVKEEKDEIMRLVNSHSKMPVLESLNVELEYGKKIEIKDDLGVLDKFEIISSDIDASINKNKLVINANKYGTSIITLRRKTYADNITTLFIGDDNESQKMAYFGIDDTESITVNVKTKFKSKVQIIKKDAGNKEVITKNGFSFKIKDLKTNEDLCYRNACEFKTKEGIYTTPFYLEEGKYELKEVKTINGYILNENPIIFEVDYEKNSNEILEIEFFNEQVMGTINVSKSGEVYTFHNNSITYDEVPIKNVEFDLIANDDIYNNSELVYKKGDVIDHFKMEENTKTIDNIYLGKYCLKETKTINNYRLKSDLDCFELKHDNNILDINITNELKKGTIVINKMDSLTKEKLSNANIKIMTMDEKEVLNYFTDENGIIKLDNLPLGKYKIKEIEAPSNYLLEDKEFFIEIKEDNEIITIDLFNKKISGNLVINKLDIDTNEPIANTTFEIYDEDNNLIYTAITDENGRICIKNIPIGKYKIVETIAAHDYEIKKDIEFFEINNNGITITKDIYNKRIAVPNTLKNKEYYIESFAVLFYLGFKWYEKKEQN